MRNAKTNVMTAAMTATGAMLAIASAASAVTTTTISGFNNLFQVAAGAGDPPVGNGASVPITNWGGNPDPTVAYPYYELREYFQPDGSYDQRVFVRANLSSVPAGSIVTSAKFNLFWFDNNGETPHSDYVDLWAVADRIEDGANFTTRNGSSPWTEGFQAGVDGWARTGAGSSTHLGFIWHSAAAPGGTPSKHVMNLAQEYKEFISDAGALETYLTGQLSGSGEANFQISLGNDSGLWQRFIAASDDGTFWPTATGNPTFANQPFLELTYMPAGSGIWNQNNDGVWSLQANWLHNVPNSAGVEALFGSVITQDTAVLVDSPHTVGGMTFDNSFRYTLSGASPITLDSTSGPAVFGVRAGSHTLLVPLQLNDNTVFSIASGSTLTVSTDMSSSAVGITKSGDGNLQVTNVRATSITIGAGKVEVLNNGTSSGRSTVNVLTIVGDSTPTAKLDITNNAMVVDHGGTSPLTTIADQVRAAYSGGSWTGNGITSSLADSSNFGVGFAERSDLTTVPAIFGSVDATAVLIRYTRFGDADLNGVVNLDDFNRLASNFNTSGKLWSQGNFNYDAAGNVNLDDFNLLAGNFNLSAGPDGVVDPEDWAALAAAVPEPGVACGAFIVAAGVLARHRRTRRVE